MWRRFERRLGFAREELRLAALVAGVDVPMLIVHDVDDRDVPWEEGQALARAAANARFVGTRGLGHRQILRAPEVVEKVRRFIVETDSAIEPEVEGALALAGRSS
jgi:pimeloyl-ACP methyl ester carboxylesterase